MEQEIWKSVLGYEGIYEVSDLGRLRRVAGGPGTHLGKCNKPLPIHTGYMRYALSRRPEIKGGRDVTYMQAHRIVIEAFHGRIPKHMQINHKNGIKTDNRLANLEVCTPSYNRVHALAILKVTVNGNPHIKGTDNPKAKIGESEVRQIRRLYDSGELSQQAIADQFGLSQVNVGRIVNRKIWTHILD